MKEVVGEPAYVAGNSLGGYIGTNLAANHPQWVSGLALLNATPFWAFRSPRQNETKSPPSVVKTPSASTPGEPRDNDTPGAVSPQPLEETVPVTNTGEREGNGSGGAGLLGWDGTLPAPAGLFRFGAWYFDRMRDPRTVRRMLGTVYSEPGTPAFFFSFYPGWYFGGVMVVLAGAVSNWHRC